MLQMKFDFTFVALKNVLSTAELSKPDIGAQSSPSARAASRGRPHFQQIVQLTNVGVGDRSVDPVDMGPSCAKQLIQSATSESVVHWNLQAIET
jgi:hypothetical protein